MTNDQFFLTVERGCYVDTHGNTTYLLAWNEDTFRADGLDIPNLTRFRHWLSEKFAGQIEFRYSSVGSLALGNEVCLLITVGSTQRWSSNHPHP